MADRIKQLEHQLSISKNEVDTNNRASSILNDMINAGVAVVEEDGSVSVRASENEESLSF